MADAYDPYWYMTDQGEWGFATTSCERAVSPSQFVDWKYYCPKGKHQV